MTLISVEPVIVVFVPPFSEYFMPVFGLFTLMVPAVRAFIVSGVASATSTLVHPVGMPFGLSFTHATVLSAGVNVPVAATSFSQSVVQSEALISVALQVTDARFVQPENMQ